MDADALVGVFLFGIVGCQVLFAYAMARLEVEI